MIPVDHEPRPWVEAAGEVVHQSFPFEPGRLYCFKGMAAAPDGKGRQRWVFPPGLYRLIGSGRNVRTYQELVCYVGVGGQDDGLLYFCPLSDWADNFELVQEGEVAT